MKAKSKKSKKSSLLYKPTVNRVYGAAIAILLIAVIVQGVFLSTLWQQQKLDSVAMTRMLVLDALRGLYDLGTDEVDKDPSSGVLSVPQARIVLPPMNDMHNRLSALYSEALNDQNGSMPAELQFTNSSAMATATSSLDSSSIDSLFNSVPVAQHCTRQVIVAFNEGGGLQEDARDGYVKKFSKTLQDGRIATGYSSTKCTEGVEEFTEYISQMQSY